MNSLKLYWMKEMTILETFRNIHLLQIGCGGTGSWLVPSVSKLANNIYLRLTDTETIYYTIVDFDIVEEQNILRQNFSEWDIGKNKAQALVNRYCYNFNELTCKNKQVQTITNMYKLFNYQFSDNLNLLIILLGCCDNNKTRHLMLKFAKSVTKKFPKIACVYIDSGNLLYNGQIITQAFNYPKENQTKLVFEKKKRKKKLDFKKMFPIDDVQDTQQSCEFFGDQSQAINNLAAALMFCNLQKILIMSELPPELITFNSSGYSTFDI